MSVLPLLTYVISMMSYSRASTPMKQWATDSFKIRMLLTLRKLSKFWTIWWWDSSSNHESFTILVRSTITGVRTSLRNSGPFVARNYKTSSLNWMRPCFDNLVQWSVKRFLIARAEKVMVSSELVVSMKLLRRSKLPGSNFSVKSFSLMLAFSKSYELMGSRFH